MPGVNSSDPLHDICAMEYDSYQHYFYDGHDSEEDFYKSTAPSEDIWKKFELVVATPPMSPIWSLEGGLQSPPSAGDKLEWVSQCLGQDHGEEGTYKIDTEEIFGNLSSIIVQDCMWSGFSATQRLEKVVNERLSNCGARVTQTTQTGTASPGAHPAAAAQNASALNNNSPAADCVDPAAVLPNPFTVRSKNQASSGSECRTDSEDEEIDVVTVESKQNRRKPVTITVRADPLDPCMKRFHISIHQQQHNYAAPSPDSYPDPEPQPKRIKQEPLTPPPEEPDFRPALLQRRHSSKPASPQSSDAEDTDKRKTHNYLERKRRNDLRSRFLALRDEIPDLADCPKTPKVVILTKATEYLKVLHASEKHKTQERKQLKCQQQQLLRKLAKLKRS
ncbi:protein L-Myc-1b isoform X1 [Polyodon spathula]|uniref:protein L-Myc-1b isoform X1 n=1 Tax=Polyodon spathula TaxID=7913 RepID=UPI001B7F4D2C|nr:protein L-Myc-1b isoform X1 [Polyodon spathula]